LSIPFLLSRGASASPMLPRYTLRIDTLNRKLLENQWQKV
jgi:hypothetical protein